MSEPIVFAASVETMFIEEGFDPAYFVTLPDETAAVVSENRLATGKRGGFGSMRVTARIGESVWETTLNSQQGGWSLPIKKPIRLAESLSEGDMIDVELQLA